MTKRKSSQPMLAGFETDRPEPDESSSGASESKSASATSKSSTEARSPAMPDLAGKTVLVVDAYSLIFQVFHVMPPMTSPSGLPTGAVHGFIRDIFDLIEKQRPEYLFCAFDAPGDTFRHDIFPQYKAGREEMPEDLRLQIPSIMRVLEALATPVLLLDRFEADDLLATIARQVDEAGGTCVLVTGDKDCRQLITDRVCIYNIRKNERYGADELFHDWGIRPDQVVDFQALVGDPTDNVPGVPLIGPKLAKELLDTYDTLDEVLAHAEEVSGKKRRENLLAFHDQALMSRRLARLDAHAPIDIDWSSGRVGGADTAAVRSLFQELGFRRLGERLGLLEGAKPTNDSSTGSSAAWRADYRVVDTPEAFDVFMAELREQRRVSFDTETTSASPRWAEIVGYAMCWREGLAYYLPVRAPEGERRLDAAHTLERLRPVLENPEVEKVGQNLKYDMIVLRGAGVELQGVAFDTMVADYLLASGEQNHGLDDLARRRLGHETIKIVELIGKGKQQRRMDEVPVALVGPYAAEDADIPLRLAGPLERELESHGLSDLLHEVELPLIDVLVEMEFNGVRVDTAVLAELSERFTERLERAEAEIYEIAGREFNIASPKQLRELLFEELGLTPVRRTKTGPSTDAAVLEQLASQHALPAKILEHRQYAKLKNTYVDALPRLVHPTTGRIHTSFNQVVAATGRLSSNDPNLQNIPVRTPEGREIRSAFIPGEPGWVLMTADYSQIELRVLAHCCQDEALLAAFARNEDIHAKVASQVNGVSLTEVTPEMRRRAKAVNFGVIYGQSPFGLAKTLGIPQEEAAEFIEAYFAQYPQVEEFLIDVLAECRRKGYVETILGRRRSIEGVRDPATLAGARMRTLPERTAINAVIQGSAADLIKLAMINVHRRMKRESFASRLLLQIHDELVFESSPEEVTRLRELIDEEMTRVHSLRVPLVVDVKTGPNWAACEPLG